MWDVSCHRQATASSLNLHPSPDVLLGASREAFHSQLSPVLWITSRLSPLLGCACAHGRSRGSHGAVLVLSIRTGAWSGRAALNPAAPASAGKEREKKSLNSSLLTAKSNYLVGFQAEGDQNGEAALNLSREAALDESWRSGGGNYL